MKHCYTTDFIFWQIDTNCLTVAKTHKLNIKTVGVVMGVLAVDVLLPPSGIIKLHFVLLVSIYAEQ